MQTVAYAGSNYNIPTVRGDTPWSGLSDFAIAAASKCINRAGGSFTLLADINFGASFGLVSAYFNSRTANVSATGIFRLAKTDSIGWRSNANTQDFLLGKDTSDNLTYNLTKVLLSGAVVNADINAAAAIAYSKLAALTVSRALVSDGSGIVAVATTTATEIGYVNGVTSAIQTQINTKSPSASPTFTGTVTLPVTADRALQTGTSSVLEASTVTKTELGYVSGVTSAIQTQITAKAADSAVVHNTGTETVAGAKTFTTQLIGKGTATNDSAAAGNIGEYVESVVGATNFPATNVVADGASISLTAGDWEVSAVMYATYTTLVTNVLLGISQTTGNSVTGLVVGSNRLEQQTLTTAGTSSLSIPGYRQSLSGTTTIYLKVQSTYTGTIPQYAVRLSARRMR